jgi:hypothetical protein
MDLFASAVQVLRLTRTSISAIEDAGLFVEINTTTSTP